MRPAQLVCAHPWGSNTTLSGHLFPYAVVRPTPTARDRVTEVRIDEDQGREGFAYRLAGGDEGAVHIDHVLEYNRDPGYMAEQLLYRLSVSARDAVAQSSLSTRELIRRLGTSPAQFYRLLDPTNYRKSMRQLLALLGVLGYEVDLTLTPGCPSIRGRVKHHDPAVEERHPPGQWLPQ